jgi:glycerol-3-phosphate dehydrogenase
VLLRRTRLGLLLPRGREAHLPTLRALCQEELGCDDARREFEAQAYLKLWRTHSSPPSARIPARPPEGEVLGQPVPELPSGRESLERGETSHESM